MVPFIFHRRTMIVNEEMFYFMIPETVFVNKRRLAFCLMPVSVEKGLRSTAIPESLGRVMKFHHPTLPIVEIRSNYLYSPDLA